MGFKDKLVNAVRAPDFDEVYLVPSRSPVDPRLVDVSAYFARGVKVNIPIVSSPMDTVTGYQMAVAIALHGGVGVVHRNMSREEQLSIVRRVKEHPPIKLRELFAHHWEPCGRVLDMLRSVKARNMPVVGENGVFVGYVTMAKLMESCRDGSEPVHTFTEPGPSFKLSELNRARWEVVRGPWDSVAVLSHDGRLLGTLVYEDAVQETQPALDESGRLLVAAAISPFDLSRAKMLDGYVDALVSDVAHFHNDNVLRASRELVKEVSAKFIAGNIATADAALDTISTIERVDGFRVGLGGGTTCTTAIVAGAYVPTLMAVALVRDALSSEGVDVPIIADGGIRSPGDAVKALAVGADTVMLGYALAGTEEAEAPKVRIGDRVFKPYRGMASRGAMEKRFSIDRYSRASKMVEEGVEGLVPYRGPVASVIREFVEGIKAGLGYAGARSIRELWEKARLIVAPPKRVEVLRRAEA